MNLSYHDLGLEGLSRLSNARSRSITAENFTGEKGKGGMATKGFGANAARELGQGWKISPAVKAAPGETITLADIEGPGVITHIWIAGPAGRDAVLRIYWDEQEQPSVECPLGDFFAKHWFNPSPTGTPPGPYFPLNSVPIQVAPYRGFNCFWKMPFRKHCRITLENRNKLAEIPGYYQIDYLLDQVPDNCAYFHAQFRIKKPLPAMEVYVILDGICGRGHYVGTSMGWGINTPNLWWGEGEVKFFLDGDGEFPTICGTGTEDYFLGSYDWEVEGKYQTYSGLYAGMHEYYPGDQLYHLQPRFGMYRWHIPDPIYFEKDLRVTVQSLGWQSDGRYHHGQHDICSTAYWYQTLPTAPFPAFPGDDDLEIL